MVNKISQNRGAQQVTKQANSENFEKFAKRLNATIPDQTSSIADKNKAINVKKQILSHPNCPADVKSALQKEIQTIEKEIEKTEKMNSSVFDDKAQKNKVKE